MGSALLNTTTEREFAETALNSAAVDNPNLRGIENDGAAEVRSADVLRMQVAERLAAHRRLRSRVTSPASMLADEPERRGTRSARIAAAVAERYARTPSYRAFLAAEAERAFEQARAAAEVAAMNAQAIAEAQQRMLDAFDEDNERAMRRTAQETARAAGVQSPAEEGFRAAQDEPRCARDVEVRESGAVELNLWPELEPEKAPRARSDTPRAARQSAMPRVSSEAARAAISAAGHASGLTVRLYEEADGRARGYGGVTQRLAIPVPTPVHTNRREYRNDAEAIALDEEIAFRQAPVFEEPAGPPVPLPANLIEFPRQLVAPRKARPRLAEGPLREETEAAPGDGQLRIFEVDPAQISTQPVESLTDAPQWSSIWLDAPPAPASLSDAAKLAGRAGFQQGMDEAADAVALADHLAVPAVQPASLGRRTVAGGIDAAIVFAAVCGFAATSLAIFNRASGCHAGAWQTGVTLLPALRLVAASIASETGVQPSQIGIAGAVVGVFLVALYKALFFWFTDATPGMRCARIGLCTFDDENPTRKAIRRRLGALLLSAVVGGFGFAWAMLDEERLTWHDRITRMYLRKY